MSVEKVKHMLEFCKSIERWKRRGKRTENI
jgi:hypothetical protein